MWFSIVVEYDQRTVCVYVNYSDKETPKYDCLDVSRYLGQVSISAP